MGLDETLFKTLLRKLDFSREQLEKRIGELVRTYNLTLLFVEHDRSFTEAISADVICLDHSDEK